MKNILLYLLFLPLGLHAQVVKVDSLPPQGLLLNNGWCWHAGDNPDFAKRTFDDSKWQSIDPTRDVVELKQVNTQQPLWIRIKLSTSSPKTISISIRQSSASEIYLNGKRIKSFGTIDPNNTIAYTPIDELVLLPLESNVNTISVRHFFQKEVRYKRCADIIYPLFLCQASDSWTYFNKKDAIWNGFNIGVPFILFLVYFTIFLFYTPNKATLWFSLWGFGGAVGGVLLLIVKNTPEIALQNQYTFYWILFSAFSNISLLYSIYLLLHQTKVSFLIGFISLSLLSTVYYFLGDGDTQRVTDFSVTLSYVVFVFYMGQNAIKKGNIAGKFVIAGMCIFIISWTIFMFSAVGLRYSTIASDVLFHIAILSLPVTIATLLGIELKNINVSLLKNLEKVQQLAAEKQQILTTQNETLERQVIERTAELEHKNRELEIEAALEKVRSASLAMHHSDEIEKVMGVLFERLKDLGLVFDGGAAIHFFAENTKDAIIWVASPDHMSEPHQINLPYDEPAFVSNPIILDVWEAHETGNHIINKTYTYEEKNRYFKDYLFKHNGYDKIPEFARNLIMAAPSYTASFIYEKNSLMGANSWTGQKFSETDIELLKRIAKVFEQAYVRFLDLKKAEAQAREAQIEAALEKVRSASLAIHQSHELEKVIVVLFDKLNELGVPFDSSFIYFFDKPKRNIEAWVASKMLPTPIKVKMPYDESVASNPIIVDLWQAIENGEHGLNKVYKEKDKDDYYRYEAKHNPTLIPESVTDLQLEAGSWITSFATEKNAIVGFDSWTGHLTTTEDFQILKRFAKVFEQAYIRFLDLQKAEAQAREAQIEAALERIRSRTMEMNTSDELNTLIGFIYAECTKLNMQLDRGFIMTFDKNTKDAHWWMVGAEAPDMPISILVKYHEYAPNLAILDAWQKRKQKWSYVVEGENKITWDDFIFVETDLSLLPDFVKDSMRSVKSVILNASFQNFGCIMLSSFEPLSEQHFDLLIRLSKVFDLTYTRFLDLQLKEQNAIKLLEEKQKLEYTLSELRATQTQLIQKEKLASLGELTAGIAHEIQNPLNFVNNFSELSVELIDELKVERSKVKEERDEELENDLLSDLRQNQEKINHHGKRASSIVKGMLEHSRQSTGERELTDINQLTDEYLRLAYHGLRAKDSDGSTLRFNSDYELIADENLPKISVVPQDIGRVLLNLINNAFYAVNQRRNLQGLQDLTGLTTYQPKVTVTTQALDNQIIIRVKDNGMGIPENILPKIFQPFFTTKPTGEGTGLGLSLAYDIVTKGHGGTMEVKSVEGQGSEFTVRLPIKIN